MINLESQIKLQAYLDGESSATEVAEIKALLARDSEAQALLEELRATSALLVGHEAEIKLPETREFFWSRIEREIERENVAATKVTSSGLNLFGWVQRHFLPIGAAALMIGMFAFLGGKGSAKAANDAGEMELASDDMGAYTFRDQQQQMTMVWLYDRTHEDSSQFTQAASAATIDPE